MTIAKVFALDDADYSRLAPPVVPRRTLRRARLSAILNDVFAHRITLVQAPTGYGKTTELALLGEKAESLLWYSLTAEDADPRVFLRQLVALFQQQLPAAYSQLCEKLVAGAQAHIDPIFIVDAIATALARWAPRRGILVLDDVHVLNDSPECLGLMGRLIAECPRNVHLVVGSRPPLNVPGLASLKVKGAVLDVGQSVLAFQEDEVGDLFREVYACSLGPGEVATVASQTEGWPIALHAVWQAACTRAVRNVDEVFASDSRCLDDLFQYLAKEIIDRVPAAVREFVLRTSVLDQLSPEACDALCEGGDSARMLEYLSEYGLFVVADRFFVRYNPLFRQFLRLRLPLELASELHRRAARYYADRCDWARAVAHLIEAGDLVEAAETLSATGESLVRAGRLKTLGRLIAAIPAELAAQRPALSVYQGDIARLRSRFDEAIAHYQRAESQWRATGDKRGIVNALRGQAMVFLDTVRPAKADDLLAEALQIIDQGGDREQEVQLLTLLAENRLNAGQPDEAERVRAKAVALGAEVASDLEPRVLLRTGRMEEARVLLEGRLLDQKKSPGAIHRFHRETPYLLALIYALQGDARRALRVAEDGAQAAQSGCSPFLSAIAATRLGHAWLIQGVGDCFERAMACYKEAMTIAEEVAVPRVGVEARLGLSWALGSLGDLGSAERLAREGRDVALAAGDVWLAALVDITLGASFALGNRFPDALPLLKGAVKAMDDCSDGFGAALGCLWLSLVASRQGDLEKAGLAAGRCLSLVDRYDYDFLIGRRTLFGPPDNRMLVPMLLASRQSGSQANVATRLLAGIGLGAVRFHPGYQLRVRTLGTFRAWRGLTEVTPAEWRRSAAKKLFQVLVARHGRLLTRDELVELIWPDREAAAGDRDFKVALAVLGKALEPERRPGAESAFVVRRGLAYGLRPGADLWLDSAEFERLVEEADRADNPGARADAYERALDLYQGDYLEDETSADWLVGERQRLRYRYLQASTDLAEIELARGRHDRVLALCHAVLSNEPCWDAAYRLLMVSNYRRGNKGEAARVYRSYARVLRAEVQAEPSSAMRRLAERLGLASGT